MGSLFRMIFGALICALVALAMTPARPRAIPATAVGRGVCIDAFVAVNICVSTLQLYSAGGTLLSPYTCLTVESSFGTTRATYSSHLSWDGVTAPSANWRFTACSPRRFLLSSLRPTPEMSHRNAV